MNFLTEPRNRHPSETALAKPACMERPEPMPAGIWEHGAAQPPGQIKVQLSSSHAARGTLLNRDAPPLD